MKRSGITGQEARVCAASTGVIHFSGVYRRRILATLALVIFSALTSRADAQTAATLPNVAFFYGEDLPVGEFQAFDAVVVDPARHFDPSAHPLAHTTWIARTEAQPDETAGAFIARVIEPLWRDGYRGFLLDMPTTLGFAAAIHAAHPDARLIAGGENALQTAGPQAKALYAAVTDPIVHDRPAPGAPSVELPAETSRQRADAALAFTKETGVPVVSVEYCGATDRVCARETAARVIALGVTPYVTDAARDVVGIGRIEVMPRKILVVQDRDLNETLDLSAGVRDLATPLNYLGYDVEYADFGAPLPSDITPDRYAGVVAWIQRDAVPDSQAWQRWITARIANHVPVAFLGQFGFDPANGPAGAALDLKSVSGTWTNPVSVVSRDPMIGFESNPKADPRDLTGVAVGEKSRSLLRLSANGQLLDEVALTPWGGYALAPYTVVTLDGIDQERWAIQPIDFMSAALHLSPLLAPSVTTENGRRLFMTHVDGDGFASRAEFPGADYSGEALYQQIFTRYQVPMTLSVIEGEVGPTGLYPKISPRLEEIARKMFALPYVAIGTHTYSHPFQWNDVDGKTGAKIDKGGGDAAFSLNIPGYTFNIDREIGGSIDYIDARLAPKGKKVVVLQWSGDCQPPGIVVRKVYEAGVYNFNGGDTVITKSANTWTNIAPIGVDKGANAYQVYAPNQDENIYTNDWQGPFYGFARVLETFDLTDHPRRFKPIDLYYHMYSGTKVASLHALDQIFTAVLKQPVLPVQVTDYIEKVLDWRSFAVARTVGAGAGESWLVRGDGKVRELHWAGTNAPRLDTGSGVTGYSAGPDGTYIHIADGSARFSWSTGTATLPYIAEANGFVRDFRRTAHGLAFDFGGYYQPFVKLANAGACRVKVAGQPVATRRDGTLLRFDTQGTPGTAVSYRSIEVTCGN
jgi:polysaccharide biosynthesis protein PelA